MSTDRDFGLLASLTCGQEAVPEIEGIIALVNQSLGDFPGKLMQLQEALAIGIKRAQSDPTVRPDVDLEKIYAAAYDSHQQRRYREALPLALYLVICSPLDMRFLFMAGMLLQSLGDPLLAANFYGVALQLDKTFVPAAFRMAECYTAVGENAETRELLETVVDLGRDSDEFFALQRLIMERLGQMNG